MQTLDFKSFTDKDLLLVENPVEITWRRAIQDSKKVDKEIKRLFDDNFHIMAVIPEDLGEIIVVDEKTNQEIWYYVTKFTIKYVSDTPPIPDFAGI